MVEFQQSVYQANTGYSGCSKTSNYRIMLKWADYSILICKLMFLAIGGMCLAFLGYPIVVYLLTGEREPIMPIFSPFFDKSTRNGYIGMSSIHITWVAQTLVGITSADIFFILSTIFVLTLVDLFENLFDQLNAALQSDKRLGDSKEVQECFNTLIQMHQDICM